MRTYILLTLCVLFWAGNFVLGRFIKEDIVLLKWPFLDGYLFYL